MDGAAVLSELVESFREDEKKRITREDFETVLSGHLKGPQAAQQICQLWDKLDGAGEGVIGQREVCSFLLLSMQQRESQVKAHSVPPLPHHPLFCSTLLTKETICNVLSALSTPPQYLSLSKDGALHLWSMRFHLQQSKFICSSNGRGRGRQHGAVWITSCVMMCSQLVVATTGRELLFYDMVSLNCLYKIHKLPYVPLCLTYGSEDESNPRSRGHLIWGDEKGAIGILSMSCPDKPLVLASQSTLISFHRLSEYAPQLQLQYVPTHTGWVCQAGWTGPSHCIISAAQSPSPSMVIQHVYALRKQYVFHLKMGVSCFSYSHALEVLASGSLDHLVRLWTPFSPQRPVATLAAHNTAVVGLAIAEESQQLFSLAQDLVLCAWDLKEHNLLQMISVKFPFTQRLPDFGPSPLTLLPLPQPTLTVTCNEYIARYTLSRGTSTEGQEGSHQQAVCALLFNPILCQVVSASEGGEVRVWEVGTGKCVLKIERCHGKQELTALAMDSNGRRLLTGARDGSVKVWESLTGQYLQSLATPGTTEVARILHLPGKRKFLATGWNRRITAFKDQDLSLAIEPGWVDGTPHNDDIIAMDYSPPHYLATGSFDGYLLVWNTDTERIMSRFQSMLKLRPREQKKFQATSSSHSGLGFRASHSTPSHSSRPASRRLSFYRLKSASSSHWKRVPVDKLLFLRARVRTQVKGQAILVSSEGGYARFWDIFASSNPLGSFTLTAHEDAIVLALATDQSNHWLLAGDTAGYISVFNISQYCTSPVEDELQPEAAHTWQAHSAEVLDLTWAEERQGGLVVSSSADLTVRLWTPQGHYVGWFGQPHSWDIRDPATFQYPSMPFPETPFASVGSSVIGLSSNGERKKDEYEIPMEKERERQLVTDSPLQAEQQLSLLSEKTLGQPYHSEMVQRIACRQERRVQFSEVDKKAISRLPSLFSPFQALHIPHVQEVKLPSDMNILLDSRAAHLNYNM